MRQHIFRVRIFRSTAAVKKFELNTQNPPLKANAFGGGFFSVKQMMKKRSIRKADTSEREMMRSIKVASLYWCTLCHISPSLDVEADTCYNNFKQNGFVDGCGFMIVFCGGIKVKRAATLP